MTKILEKFEKTTLKTFVRHFIVLIFFAIATYFVSGEMKKLMSSKQVVAFEFLGTEAAAKALLASEGWQRNDTQSVSNVDLLRQHTYWDFAYILCYVSLFVSLAHLLLGNAGETLKAMTKMLLIAGSADAAENAVLLQILYGSLGFFPAAMFCLATIKFGILILFVLWLLMALVKKLLGRK